MYSRVYQVDASGVPTITIFGQLFVCVEKFAAQQNTLKSLFSVFFVSQTFSHLPKNFLSMPLSQTYSVYWLFFSHTPCFDWVVLLANKKFRHYGFSAENVQGFLRGVLYPNLFFFEMWKYYLYIVTGIWGGNKGWQWHGFWPRVPRMGGCGSKLFAITLSAYLFSL